MCHNQPPKEHMPEEGVGGERQKQDKEVEQESHALKQCKIVYFEEDGGSDGLEEAVTGVMAPTNGVWACTACTFENVATATRCEICETIAPGKKRETCKQLSRFAADDIPELINGEPSWQSILNGPEQRSGYAEDDQTVGLSSSSSSSSDSGAAYLNHTSVATALTLATPSSSTALVTTSVGDDGDGSGAILVATHLASIVEIERIRALSMEDLYSEMAANLKGGAKKPIHWVLAALVLIDVRNYVQQQDISTTTDEVSLARKFVEDGFDKLVRTFLDVFNDSSSNRSWRDLSERWKALDHAAMQEISRSQNQQTGEEAQQLGDAPSESELPAEKPLVPSVYDAMSTAFEDIVCTSVSIAVLLAERKDLSKLEVLDNLLDPKSSRYYELKHSWNHPSYATSCVADGSSSEKIDALHLHARAVETFLAADGLAALTALAVDMSLCNAPGPMIGIASPVARIAKQLCQEQSELTTLAAAYDGRDQVKRFLTAALDTVARWPLVDVITDTALYTKAVDILDELADNAQLHIQSTFAFGRNPVAPRNQGIVDLLIGHRGHFTIQDVETLGIIYNGYHMLFWRGRNVATTG